MAVGSKTLIAFILHLHVENKKHDTIHGYMDFHDIGPSSLIAAPNTLVRQMQFDHGQFQNYEA